MFSSSFESIFCFDSSLVDRDSDSGAAERGTSHQRSQAAFNHAIVGATESTSREPGDCLVWNQRARNASSESGHVDKGS